METTVLERPSIVDKIRDTSFCLDKSKNSKWLRDGTGEDTGVPSQFLHSSNLLMLSIKSRLFLGKGQGYMPTMYIPNAVTHYVNDYWVTKNNTPVFDKLTNDQAKEKGLEHRDGLLSIYGKEGLVEQERIAKGKHIHFKNGELHLLTFGDDPVLLDFVNEHEWNKNAPNAKDNPARDRIALFAFRPLMPEKKAAEGKRIGNFDAKRDAINFVDKLRTKTKEGYAYDEAKIDALLYILGEGLNLQPGEVNQKFEKIVFCYELDPVTFLKIINEKTDEYRLEIGKAESLNVLEYEGKVIKATIDGKKKTLLSFDKAEKKEDMLENFVYYLIGSKNGQADYREIKRSNDSARIAALKK